MENFFIKKEEEEERLHYLQHLRIPFQDGNHNKFQSMGRKDQLFHWSKSCPLHLVFLFDLQEHLPEGRSKLEVKIMSMHYFYSN